MNPGGLHVETALYLVAPYRNPLNRMKQPGGSILSSPSDQLSHTETIPELKLHYFAIPSGFTGGRVSLLKNPCSELRYFFSKTSDVVLNWRDGIGGFYELMFLNGQHNYTRQSAQQDQSGFAPGASFDITAELTDMRSLYGDQTTTYMYLFCPFIAADASSAEFELQVILDKQPVALKDKDKLELDQANDNLGPESPLPAAPVRVSLSQRVVDIIKQVKGEGNPDLVRKRMEESPSTYFEVIQRDLSVDLWSEDAADVKRVGAPTD